MPKPLRHGEIIRDRSSHMWDIFIAFSLAPGLFFHWAMGNKADSKATPAQLVGGFFAFCFGAGYLLYLFSPSSSSPHVASGDSLSKPLATASKTAPIVIGNRTGEYETLSPPRKLEAHAMDYVNKKVEFEADVGIGGIEISQNYGRLQVKLLGIGPYAIHNVDVLVRDTSPFYDRLIEMNPQLDDHILIRGTVHTYSNSFDSVWIDPDELTIMLKPRY